VNEASARRDELVKMFRDYRKKIAEWLEHPIPDEDYEKSDDFKAAMEFYRIFKPQDNVDYGEPVKFARELYERYENTGKLLDEKADSIIKYLGGGSALITFGALVSLKIDNQWSCTLGIVALVSLLPSLVCAFLAVSSAINARKPQTAATLPNVKFAVEMAEYYKKQDELEPNLWLIFYPLCEAALHRNLRKAKIVHNAHTWYKRSMWLLLIPVIAIAICLVGAAAFPIVSSKTTCSPLLRSCPSAFPLCQARHFPLAVAVEEAAAGAVNSYWSVRQPSESSLSFTFIAFKKRA
jgi:flagellar basal body-associated protein FliL